MIVLETARLQLREWSAADAPALYAIVSDPVTMQFWPAPFTREATEAWIARSVASYAANGFGRWALLERDSGQIVGDCGILLNLVDGVEEHDLGYIVHHRYWGRGYAPEAALACRDYGIERLGLRRLVANMATENRASERVAQKIGMVLEKTFNNVRNRELPTYVYAYEPAR